MYTRVCIYTFCTLVHIDNFVIKYLMGLLVQYGTIHVYIINVTNLYFLCTNNINTDLYTTAKMFVQQKYVHVCINIIWVLNSYLCALCTYTCECNKCTHDMYTFSYIHAYIHIHMYVLPYICTFLLSITARCNDYQWEAHQKPLCVQMLNLYLRIVLRYQHTYVCICMYNAYSRPYP